MENPATWSKATWMVQAAIERHREAEESEIIGLSLPALVVQMLRETGYLTEESLEVPGVTDLSGCGALE